MTVQLAEQPVDQPLSLLRRLLRLGADHPGPVLLFVLVISVVALMGALRVELDTGMSRLTEADGIDRQTYLHIAREFGSDRRNVIYLRDEQMWTPERLLAVRRLHDALLQLPFVERVESVYASPTVVVEEDRWLAQPLLSMVPQDGAAAEMARQRALTDPLAARHLVSADGKALAIGIAMREDATGDIQAAIEAVLAPQRGQFATAFQVGPARLQHTLQTALRHDLVVVLPVFLLVLWGMLWFFTRSAFAATLPLLVGILSLLWTVGALGYASLPVGVLAILLPLLATLAGTLQILRMAAGAYAEVTGDAAHLDHYPRDRRRLTEFMVRGLGLPLILTVLTLVLGFVSTLFMQDTQALHDFSLAAILVMLSSGILCVLLVPALVALLVPLRTKPVTFPALTRFAEWLLGMLGLLRQRRVFGSLTVLLLVGATVFLRQAPGIMLANDPWSYFRADEGLLRDAARLQADLAGPQVFYVMLDSNVEGGFREPVNLRRLADIQAFITKQQVFDRSHSLADLAMQANPAAAGNPPQIPTTRRLVMQALMPHAQRDLEPYVSHDWRRANIIVRHNLRDSSQINHHVGELRQAVANYAGPGMVTAVVGESLLVNAAADQFPRMQLTVTLLLLGTVFVIMTLMYTSIKGGLAALAPGLVPIVLMLGGMQLLQIPLSPATLVVAILVIGIAAESSVHLFSRYSALARTMSDSEDAALETVRRETLPMLAIHLTLAAGCLVWLAADFALAVQFGMLTAATLLLSALANLILMPLLMSHIRLVGLYEMLALSMQREALEASPLFQGMSDFQIRKTILISDRVDVAAGQRLITQGSIDRSMYVVVNGRFEVVRREGSGEQRRAVVGPGDVIGEIGFVRETRRIADVRALGPASALRFDYARLKKDLAYFPYLMNRLNFNISGILGQRLAELVEAQPVADAVQPPPTFTERDT